MSAHADVWEEDVGFSAGTAAAVVLSRPAAGDRSTTPQGPHGEWGQVASGPSDAGDEQEVAIARLWREPGSTLETSRTGGLIPAYDVPDPSRESRLLLSE